MNNAFKPGKLIVVLSLAVLSIVSLHAQVVSGSLSGVVTDSQGAVVPGAKVTLIDQVQATTRSISSGAEGTFNFTPVLASTYKLVVESAGFKKYERTDIVVHPNDQIEVPNLKLEVGTINETVTVEAETVTLKTESVQQDTVITGEQSTDLPIVDRGFLGLLQVVPGYASGDQYSANINGNRSDNMSIKLDGMTNMDSGVNACCSTWVNPDSIAEMKIVTNTQSAAIGHAGGASVMVVTKGGTKSFHGSGYGFIRNESMNANGWLNDYNNRPKAIYRYDTYGFTVGGPVFIPKTWNVDKNKLFFFASEERKDQKLGASLNIKEVPTAAERTGDFSAAVSNSNQKLYIRDPLTNLPCAATTGVGGGCFPNNIIPINRISKDGQTLLNAMPLPNYSGDPTYNFTSEMPYNQPELIGTYKFDYNINEKWHSWVRYTRDHYTLDNPYGISSSFPTLGTNETTRHAMGLAVAVTTVLTPTLTNEAILGGSQNLIPQQPKNTTYTRTGLGLTYQNLFPTGESGDLGPIVSFGGSYISNSPSMGNGIPYYADNTNYSITDNLAKVFAKHTLKFGVSIEHDRKDQTSGNPVGTISFGQDTNNINDSNYSFSNALMGNYDTYSQIDKQRFGRYYFTNAEWYLEDTWKVTSKLTIIPGIRVSLMQPIYDAKGQSGDFVPSLYNQSQAVRLYSHAVNPATGTVQAYDPVTKAYMPSVYYGSVVPGSGNQLNGVVLGGTNGVPKGLVQNRGPQWGPRFGMAYQLDAKTVIRAGAGISYDRLQGNVIYGDLSIPPTTITRTAYYGNLTGLAAVGANALFSPPNPGNNGAGMSPDGHVPTVYNWNFTIERELPFSTILTAAYVGNMNRHLMELVNVNDPGWGSAWLPQNQDPTLTPKYDGTTTINTNFFRPYVGIDKWNLMEWGGTANYNSLQMTATHRMSRKLTFTAAYSFSKVLGTADSIYNAGAIPNEIRQANYGRLSYDRTQSLVVSYSYWLPKVVRGDNLAVNNFATRLILNDWQLSGITTMRSGAPTQIGYSINGYNSTMITTGDPDYGPRPVFTSSPIANTRTSLAWFNTASFVPAPKGSHGNDSGIGYLEGPGQNNFDMVLQKNIPFSKDSRRYFQFRMEAYNALNKTQWSGLNTSATLAGGTTVAAALANPTITNLPVGLTGASAANGGRFGFGALNAVRAARIVQLGLKLYF